MLELGSGAGFLGIVIATLQGPSHVHTHNRHNSFALWLTDVDPNVLERCQNNIRLPCSACLFMPSVTAYLTFHRCLLLPYERALRRDRLDRCDRFVHSAVA